MRTWSPTAFILLATLAGCDPLEAVETSYPDMADAASGGSVSRGWIPGWLAADASDIREIHNLDTNESALAFDTPRDLSWAPPAECRTTMPCHMPWFRGWTSCLCDSNPVPGLAEVCMRKFGLVLRWLFGLFYLYVGVSWFVHKLIGKPWVTPPEPPLAKAITSTFSASGVVDPFIAPACLVGGALLLVQRTAPLGIAVLAPLVTGIFLFHVFLTGSVVWGSLHLGVLAVLAWLHRSAFRPLWSYSGEDPVR